MNSRINECEDSIISDLNELTEKRRYNDVIDCTTKYLEKFPNNQKVRIIRANMYIRESLYDLAIEDLKYNSFLGDDESLGRLYLLYYFLNRYNEALKLLPIVVHKKCIDYRSEVISEIIIKKELGIPFSLKKNHDFQYVKSQIMHYNLPKVLEHIKRHLYIGENKNIPKTRTIFFNDDINLNYLFFSIKKSLTDYHKAIILDSLDIYYFYIDGIGYGNDNIYNILKVVVVPNTNKIITMFPIDRTCLEDVNNIYLDYYKLFNNRKQIVKKISQIDKFNKKFLGINN